RRSDWMREILQYCRSALEEDFWGESRHPTERQIHHGMIINFIIDKERRTCHHHEPFI
ncbi:hypothetical protein F2P79_007353, partial [Pimephales promelas]